MYYFAILQMQEIDILLTLKLGSDKSLSELRENRLICKKLLCAYINRMIWNNYIIKCVFLIELC